MGEGIDLPVTASGDDGVNRLTSAIDRLTESMTRLGDNSALNKLSEQMQLMQATMVTGFANLAATAEKTLQGLALRQVRAIEEGGEKAANAMTEAGLKIKAADARTWEQIQRGSSANVTAAFNQLAQGIPVEAVEARFGKMAATTAAALDGQLARLRQFQENAKSLFQTAYRPMAGPTEAEIDRARAMNTARDAALRTKSASNVDARTLLGLPSQAETRTIGQQIAAQMREAVTAENLRARSASAVDARTLLGLPSQAEARSVGQQIAAQLRESVTAENLRARSASTIDARTLLGLPQESEVRAAGRQIAAQLRDAVAAEQAAERNRGLNANFLSASPLSQLNAAGRVQAYLQQPGSSSEGAAARFGSAAASADINALRAAYEGLAPAVTRSSAAAVEHNLAMNEAHSLARGLAGSLGGLWLTYGSLVPLAAGAAIAASLKSVVSVGAEVEHQLTNVLALTKSSVNLDTFLQVSEGSLRSLVEGSNAMRMLAQNGLNAVQSLQVLPSILDLATVGEMTVGQAALAATGAASAFGLSYSEAGRIADIFALTAANSNTSVLAMTESMRQASTVASLFKVSIEETAAMLGLLAKINVTGGAAGTSMTNMLTGLYEPTEKGKKALKELGVETQMASGALKPLTSLLEEMRGALSRYTDSARVDLLGSIFTVRGVKSAQLALDNIDDFKRKTEEAAGATGFMASVVRKLEDDSAGGFERLGVVVQNSFVRSFREASPFVQRIALDLGDAFKDGGTASTGLQNFSTNVARLTGVLVENLGIVTMLGAGYVALRALGPTVDTVWKAVAASAAHTTAVAAETAALGAVTTANLGAGASAAEVTAFVTAQTAATEAATAATLAWEATLLPVLTAVGIALGVAGAAWLLFRDNTSEADRTNQQIANSLHVINEALEREIEQLERANKLWDEKNGKYRAPETVTQSDIDKARDAVTKLENEARAKGKNPADLRNPQMLPTGTPGIMTSSVTGYTQLSAALVEADRNLNGLLQTQRRVEEELNPAKAVKGVHDATAQLREELDKFYADGNGKNSKEEFYQQNAAVRAVHEQAKALKEQLLDPTKVLPDVEAEMQRISALKVDLKQLNDQANSLLTSHTDKGDKDAARTRIEQLQEELRLKQMVAKDNLDNDRSLNKRGELGDLQLINHELETKHRLNLEALSIARQERDAAGPLSGAQREKFNSKIRTIEQQDRNDTNAAERARKDYLDKAATQELKARAETLTKRGELDKAFEAQWEADYGRVQSSIEKDLKDAQNEEYREKLEQQRDFLKQLHDEGKKTSIFQMDTNAFDAELQKVKTKLNNLKLQNGPGTGLTTQINNQLRAGDTMRAALPLMNAEYQKMVADAGDDPVKLKAADRRLKEIQEMSAALRNEWVNIGQTIGQALTDAFGRGGTAVAGLIDAATSYGAKVQDIRAAYEKSDGGTEAQRQASEDMAAAQVKAYGTMASAAKGFFDQNSHGYKILHATEQAFRVYELTTAIGNAAKKIALEGGVTAALMGGEEARASAVLAGTEVQVAADQVKGQSAAAVGIANQAQGDPYSAWIRMAAMAAAMASLGFAVMGGIGGGGASAADRQAENGTGTVAGDPKAKSESIAKSLELVSKNTYNNLNVSLGMLASLQAIEANLSNFAGLLVQNTNITNPEVQLNKNNGLATTLAAGGGLMGGGLLGGLMSKIPAVGKLGTAIFGGKQTLDDSGFMLSKSTLGAIAAGGAQAQTYADVTTDGGWLRSDSHDTKTTALSAEANRAITQVIVGMGDAVKAAGGVLGLSGAKFEADLNSFTVDLGKISLKDLNSSEQQAAIQAAFSKLGDQMAQSAISTISQFSKAGEGALQTLMRVATDYQAVDAVLSSFGMTFSQVGVASLAARERLIDLSGGLDKFLSQGEYLMQNFYSDKEQAASLAARINPTLAQYGISASSENLGKLFRNLVTGFDTTTQSGAEAYTSLMNIAPAVKQIVDVQKAVLDERKGLQDQLDELTMTSTQLLAKQRDALDESNRALFDQIQALKAVSPSALLSTVDTAYSTLEAVIQREKTALQKRIDTESEVVGKLSSISSSVKSALSSLDEPSEAIANRKAAQDTLGRSLSLMQSGAPLSDAQVTALQDALNTVTKDSKSQFSSYEDYSFDRLKTLRQVQQLDTVSAKQKTDAQKQLDEMKAQSKSLDDQLTSIKQQVDLLKGINTSTLTMAQAMQNFELAMGAAKANPAVGATSAITQAYQNSLGRAADADGLSFWQKQAANGTSVDEVVKAISNSPEAQVQKLYQSLLGRSADAAGMRFWLSGGASISQIEAGIKSSNEYKSHQKALGIPGFAGGGDFGGGVRLVGEIGPEIEATGAARIHSTQSLLNALRTPDAQTRSDTALFISTFNTMNQTLDLMRLEMRAVATHSAMLVRILKRVTPNGDAIVFRQADPLPAPVPA
jgi:TP901 family phage tail tape measure protein